METLKKFAAVLTAILLIILISYILDEREKNRVLILAETHPPVKAIVSKELTFYFEPLPQYAAESVPEAIADITNAIYSWSPHGATVKRAYTPQEADITVSWVRDYGYHTLGQSIYGAHIKVGLGTTNCYDEWMAFDGNTVKKVLWHELGHSMGYGHSDNQGNVMYPDTETRFEVNMEISEVIAPGWYVLFPFCGSGTYSYLFETEDPNHGFEIAFLPPGADPDNLAPVIGRSYADCGGGSWQRLSGSCTVEEGAGIYILNDSLTEAIRLSGQVISLTDIAWPDMEWDPDVFLYDKEELQEYNDLFNKKSSIPNLFRRFLD